MIIAKFAKQKWDLLKKTHPDLYATIAAYLPELNEDTKGKVAGLIIEYVLKSNGSINIFQDDILSVGFNALEDGYFEE